MLKFRLVSMKTECFIKHFRKGCLFSFWNKIHKIYNISRNASNKMLLDCILLQENLKSMVCSWASGIWLELNISKCHVMTCNRCCKSVDFCAHSVQWIWIKRFDRCMCFHSHIESVTRKALKMLSFINRISFDFKLYSSLKTIFIAHLYLLT